MKNVRDMSIEELRAETRQLQSLLCLSAEDPPAADPAPDPEATPADPPADPEATDPDATPGEPSAAEPPADPDVEAEFQAVTERLESLARQVSKAGRVLSGANEDRLRRSHELIGEVLSQLDQQDDDGDDDKLIQLTDDDGNVLLTMDQEQLAEIMSAAKETAASELRRASGALD